MVRIGLIDQDDLAKQLEGYDYDIVFSCGGENAIEQLDKHGNIDVVITDIVMTGQDGISLIEMYSHIKFIVVTAINNEVFIERAIQAGALSYLVKPVDLRVVKQRLNNVNRSQTARVIKPKTVSERTLDERISNIFVSVGIPAHIKGYQYLREGIKLAVDNPPIINSITKVLYPTIADHFETTSSKVERAIRHAIEVAWNRGRIENINSLFGIKVYSSQDKPTNGEFIALLADKMLLECSY